MCTEKVRMKVVLDDVRRESKDDEGCPLGRVLSTKSSQARSVARQLQQVFSNGSNVFQFREGLLRCCAPVDHWGPGSQAPSLISLRSWTPGRAEMTRSKIEVSRFGWSRLGLLWTSP